MEQNEDKVIFYNAELKEQFLSEFDDATRRSYQRVLSEVMPYEEESDKDICDFSIAEMRPFLEELGAKTISAAKSNCSVLSSYIQFAIEKGCKANRINQLKGNSQAFYASLVKDVKIYYTDREFARIINRCVNAQDSATFFMIFQGVQGLGCAEIVNLKKWKRGQAHETPDGADWGIDEENNLLRLKDSDGSVRILEVSEECIEEVIKASKQNEYFMRNGDVEDGSRRTVTNLNSNDFVIRNSETNLEKNNEAADKHTVYRRCKVIAEVLGLSHFTVKGISRSGMLARGKEFLKENGEITHENYVEIAERFKFNSIQHLKEIVNEKTIKELYGDIF